MNIGIDLINMGTQIRLSAKAEKRLDFLTAQTGRTKAFYIRKMIENSLDDLEDYYFATEVLERVRGGEIIESSAAVRTHLGLMPTSQTCERLRQLRGKVHFTRTAAGGTVESRWLSRRFGAYR
jgi:RHH-type rel operon transcriptional repressor/antitoxin RelB